MSKYHAHKTVINGIRFDSKAEANYYLILLDKQRTGEIQGFTLQPKFILQESFKKNGKTYRAITYIADFLITHNDDSVEVIDVKGVITKEFAIKRKLFEAKFPGLALTLVDGKGNVI